MLPTFKLHQEGHILHVKNVMVNKKAETFMNHSTNNFGTRNRNRCYDLQTTQTPT